MVVRIRNSVPRVNLGPYLRQKRVEQQVSQEEAAEKLHVSRKTYASWERGSLPRIDSFFAIADWTGESLDEIRAAVEEKS